MSDRTDIEYNVRVTGLGEAQAGAQSAAEGAKQATEAMQTAQLQSNTSIPTMIMTMRAANAARLAVQQTSKGIHEMNLTSLMYGFLNMIQVVRNLTSLTKTLKESTGAAAAARAILMTLTGQWWLIPVALAAGALVYTQIRSMQTGGTVTYTGLHYLHKGETVVPANQRLGPIFITFNQEPEPGLSRDHWLNQLGETLTNQIRRGS
jgi:hypothetical protein